MGSKTNLNLIKFSLESLTLLHAHEGERMPRMAYSNIKHGPCRDSPWKRMELFCFMGQTFIFASTCKTSYNLLHLFPLQQPSDLLLFKDLECFVLVKVSLAEKTLMMTRPVEVLWHEKSCQTWCCVAEWTLVMLADVLVLVMRSWLCVGGAVLFRV